MQSDIILHQVHKVQVVKAHCYRVNFLTAKLPKYMKNEETEPWAGQGGVCQYSKSTKIQTAYGRVDIHSFNLMEQILRAK